jgi:hypothetical protein
VFEFPTTRQYDLMRGLLLVIGCFVLSLVNMSRIYHYIRSVMEACFSVRLLR